MFWNCGRVSKQPGARRTPKLSVCPNMYICFGGGLDGIFIFGPFEVSKTTKLEDTLWTWVCLHNVWLRSTKWPSRHQLSPWQNPIQHLPAPRRVSALQLSLMRSDSNYQKNVHQVSTCFACTISIISIHFISFTFAPVIWLCAFRWGIGQCADLIRGEGVSIYVSDVYSIATGNQMQCNYLMLSWYQPEYVFSWCNWCHVSF